MKSIKETVSSFAIRQALNYARKDPDKNLMNLLNLFEKADIKKVNRVTYENLHKVLDDPNNNWTRFIKRILFDVDSGVLDKFVPVFMNIALNSYSLRTQAIEKYHCNIPWAILIDPTAACNLHCKGCWAAEYGKESTLGFETLSRVVKEGKAVGTFMYIFSGGEPLVKRISSACVRRIRTVRFLPSRTARWLTMLLCRKLSVWVTLRWPSALRAMRMRPICVVATVPIKKYSLQWKK